MSNESKSAILGLNVSTASQRLRKLILWQLIVETGKDYCFQCGERIEDVDDLSIEHKEPWQSAADPKASFFDLENIAFSHLRCNVDAAVSANGAKTHCPLGHPYTDDNTRKGDDGSRHCKQCFRLYNREWMRQSREHSSIGRASALQVEG